MRAGDLNDVCRWHKRIVEVQRSGAVKERYEDMGDVRCNIPQSSGSTRLMSDRVSIDDSYKVLMRMHYDISEYDHIIIGGITYYVDYVSRHRRAGMIVLTLKREQQ